LEIIKHINRSCCTTRNDSNGGHLTLQA